MDLVPKTFRGIPITWKSIFENVRTCKLQCECHPFENTNISLIYQSNDGGTFIIAIMIDYWDSYIVCRCANIEEVTTVFNIIANEYIETLILGKPIEWKVSLSELQEKLNHREK
jgi:hypothetical protein